jgi:hypothetical protein
VPHLYENAGDSLQMPDCLLLTPKMTRNQFPETDCDAQREGSDVPKAALIVYTNPISTERDDDYNRWYDEIHLPEILAADGFVAASRYRISDAQVGGMAAPDHRYVAVYEVDTDDLQGALDTLLRSAADLDMGDSVDQSTASAALWEEITPRVASA